MKTPLIADNDVPAPKVGIVNGSVSPDATEYEDDQEFIQSAMAATGINSRELAVVLIEQLIKTFGSPKEGAAPHINAALAALAGQKPRNATEALLSTQMVAVHTQLMNLLAKSANTSLPDAHKSYINLAMKLARVFATQAETLRRIRQKGRQTISVHHVHLNNDGGQAIIGNVTRSNKEGG